MKTLDDGTRIPAIAEYAVACDPYQGETYIVTRHTRSAVLRAASKAENEFRRRNTAGSYGHRYYPVARWEGSDGWQEIRSTEL